MAEQVEPGGSVLVTDINTRFLNTLIHPLIQVTQHDIVEDPLPENHFDLIHARLVLTWIHERDRALRRMVHALKPGGWLMIEDFDPGQPVDAAFDGPELAVRLYEAQTAVFRARGRRLQVRRRLPALFRSSGIQEVGSEGRVLQWRGGSPGMDVVWSNCMQLRPAIIGSGALTGQEFDEAMSLLKTQKPRSFRQSCGLPGGAGPSSCDRVSSSSRLASLAPSRMMRKPSTMSRLS